MTRQNKISVIMADSSDIYHDGRILKEASALYKAGYQVKIYGFHNFNFTKQKYNFKITTLPFVSRKYRRLRHINIIFNIIIINFIIIFRKADIYHSHNTMFFPGLYLSSRIWGGKLIFDSHEVQCELGRIPSMLEKLFIYCADAVINVSSGRAEFQAQRYNLEKNKITVISNYPEIPASLPEIKQKTTGAISFIYSGGFILGTNRLDNFILALKDFSEYSFTLMAFGYGTGQQQLENLIKYNKLEEKIKFTPLVRPDEVVQAIAKYDVAVDLTYNPKNMISYKYHGINKMYEYLMAGLPILCSNLTSFITDFEENGVGKSVDPIDINSIQEGIRYFIENKDMLFDMKIKARELALSKFNWNTQKVKLITLYNSLK